MKMDTVLLTLDAAKVAGATISMHGTTGTIPMVAVIASPQSGTGISCSINGTTQQMRAFAQELLRHVDATDEAQARLLQGAAA